MTSLPPLLVDWSLDQGLVDAASAAVRGYCGWHIGPSISEDLTLDGSGGAVQFVPSLLVTDLTAVVEDGVALDVTTLDWSAVGVIEKTTWPACWSSRLRGVVVSLTHGFDTWPDVEQVVRGLVANGSPSGRGLIKQAGPFVYDTTSTSGSVAALSVVDKAVLNRYRIPARF